MLEQFQKVGRLLFEEGLTDAFGGNLSVRQGDKILITRRDVFLGSLTNEDLVEVGLEADDKDSQASRELEIHRAVYRQTQAKALVHGHPANAIAISITDNKIMPQDFQGQNRFKSAAIVRARDSQETSRLLPQFLNGENAVAVVKGHGSYAIGQSLTDAYMLTSALENSCKVLVAVRSTGSSRETKPLPHKDQRSLRPERKSAIPPSIGVMDRGRYRQR